MNEEPRVNQFGVAEEDLVLVVYSDHISAKPLIDWIRDFQRRLPLFATGIEEPTAGDRFALQMVRTNFDMAQCRAGTHTSLPEDIKAFLQSVTRR